MGIDLQLDPPDVVIAIQDLVDMENRRVVLLPAKNYRIIDVNVVSLIQHTIYYTFESNSL